MDSQKYFTLLIGNIPRAQEDTLVSELFDIGASGVQENLEFVQSDRRYQPDVVEAEVLELIVYFEQPPKLFLIEDLVSRFSGLTTSMQEHDQVDWLALWKEQWKPFELLPRVWVVPDWHRESFQPEQGDCLYIEPGMAFGTGTHATTQLAAQLMAELQAARPLQSLVDVGTGSGILILLAHSLGIERLTAYDNDEECARVFQENMEKNGVSRVKWTESWSDQIYDVTVANIIDGVLIDLKQEFQKTKSQYYIFTGILKERERLFLDEMLKEWPLQQVSRKEKDEWVGFLFESQL